MEQYAVPNKLPAKQINILAHRRKRIINEKAQLRQKLKHQKPKVGSIFHKAEYFVAEKRKSIRDGRRMMRDTQKHGIAPKHLKDLENGRLIIVLRHRAKRLADQTTFLILQKLRLDRMHNAVFLKVNDEIRAILHSVEPYVVYGYPNISTIRELIFKYTLVETPTRKRGPISCNSQIEELFGNFGIICLEDIIHEISTMGKYFHKVTKFMYPFQLKNPKEGWQKRKGLRFDKGGEYGFRGDQINNILKEIL